MADDLPEEHVQRTLAELHPQPEEEAEVNAIEEDSCFLSPEAETRSLNQFFPLHRCDREEVEHHMVFILHLFPPLKICVLPLLHGISSRMVFEAHSKTMIFTIIYV